MKIFYSLFIILQLSSLSQLFAQDALQVMFSYDAAGNRTGRTYDLNLALLSAKLDSTENFSAEEYAKEIAKERFESNGGFILYPNPTQGQLVLEIQNLPEEARRIKLIVQDANGKIIQKLKGVSEFNLIDLSSFRSGIYFLEYRYMQDKKIWKIVKK